ncbi:hypothetical protein Tco_1344988 [Tanacetum coccineum]
MWNSIQNGPFMRPMIPDPDSAENINGTVKQILEPLSKMTKGNKKQYIADMKVMNYLLQAIPNDIYYHVRHSRLMDEFEKFAAKEGESLKFVYEKLTTLVNIIDRNNVHPISVSINTKFLNCLQPEWSKYVTMFHHNQTGETVSYDMLYDSLVKLEQHILASKSKKAVKNHDPLALIAHSNASSSQSHANSSYSSQPYYVTHPSSVVDYEDEYQGDLQGDSQEEKLTTSMMLLARAITQKFSTPTNNHLRTSSNTRNQAVIQDGQVDIQTKNASYGGNVLNYNEKGHYARDCQNPRVCDGKYFKEQMLLAMKDEAESNLNNKENDFMLDTLYGEETFEELTDVVMVMAQIQPVDGNAETVPSYDANAISELNASSKVHEQMRHEKRKIIIQTSDDDQIDSNIIFDDPYMENNGGTSDHDSNDHDEYHKIQMLAYYIQREAKNKKRLNNELKKQKMLLQKLERELRNDKNIIDRLLKDKENIQSDFFKIEIEKIIIHHETQLAKKAFKERENWYLEDIVDLKEKLSSHDRIVYKMGQSIQTIHMLGKTLNKVHDPFLKAGLGYKNRIRLKKAIAA